MRAECSVAAKAWRTAAARFVVVTAEPSTASIFTDTVTVPRVRDPGLSLADGLVTKVTPKRRLFVTAVDEGRIVKVAGYGLPPIA